MTVLLGGPGKRCVVLMNQSSRDHTLLDVRPSPGPGRGAVSPQSSRDKRTKHSLPGTTVRREGRAISELASELMSRRPREAPDRAQRGSAVSGSPASAARYGGHLTVEDTSMAGNRENGEGMS